MAKVIVLFRKPKDPELFDKEYWNNHVPMVKKMPGVRKYTVSKIVSAPRGEPEYYQAVELEFDNMDSLKKALDSPAGREAGRHSLKIATGGITFMYAESKEA
ncbi:MAG TPA: EthD family reductase [Candidatus Bathyarchaeia archaeon]|nr:EthD family reductase [Candidatus Bathyarchaeia archaeon]